jgi:uncharacterized membrane protein
MICPFCQHNNISNLSICPQCKSDLSDYKSFLDLKADLADINTSISTITSTVGRISSRLSKMESAMFKPVNIPVHAEPEPELKPVEVKAEPEPGPSPVVKIEEKPKPAVEHIPAAKPATVQKPRTSSDFEVHLGQKWLLIAGIIFTVLAIGWFLKYSFERNWVGPAGRVAMSYLTGLIFLGAGEWFRRKKLERFGLYLAGGGIAILYFASFAGFYIFHLISQPVAFGLMILVTALACTLSIFYDTKWLSVLGLIGGFATPVALGTGVDNQTALMSYMTILNAGILTIAFFRQWKLLNYLGFTCTYALFSGWYVTYYSQAKFWPTMVFLNIFFLIYAFVPFVYHIKREHEKELVGLGMVVMNSFIALGYSFIMIREYSRIEYASIITLLYAAIFLWMAHFIFRHRREQVEALVMLLANAMLFLVLTVPILFSEEWITVFWVIQAATILWASIRLKNKLLYFCFSIVFILAVGKFYFYDYFQVFQYNAGCWCFSSGYAHDLLGRILTTIITMGAMLQTPRMVAAADPGIMVEPAIDKKAFWVIFLLGLFATLNIEVSGFFRDYSPNAQFASISVLWTIFSIAVMAAGFIKNIVVLRHTAIGLFAITMLKVFFVDMANASTPFRIVSFLVLGMVLIGASYLYYKFKDRILSDVQRKD